MSRLMRAIAILLLALATILNSSSPGLAAQESTPSPLQIVPTPTPTPWERSTLGDTYTDPVYGWSVSWNSEKWDRFLDGDVLELTTTTESGYGWRLTFTTIAGADDTGWAGIDVLNPKSCLVAMENRDVVHQYGAGSVPLQEVSRDRAWGIYADDEVQPGNAYYMDCWLIPGKNALLMIHGSGPFHLFNEIAPRLEALVSQVTIPAPPISHACDSSQEPAPSVATDREGLFALLPPPYMAPRGFDTGTDASATFEQAVGAMGGTREASELLEDLGWTAHVSRAFNNENPSPGSTDALLVSIHGFKDGASAAIAFDAYSDYLVAATRAEDAEGPNFCDQSRYLTSTDQYGNVSTSLYVQNGPVLYRIWGVASEGGDPTPELITLATQMFGSSEPVTSSLHATPDEPVAPTAEAGRNEFATVINALRDAGLDDVDPGRYTATANQLEQPGQVIEIGETNAFVFIYPDADPDAAVATREADAADLDPETLVLTARTAERPLNEDMETHVFEASNVIVVLAGGDEDLVRMVQDAVESLP